MTTCEDRSDEVQQRREELLEQIAINRLTSASDPQDITEVIEGLQKTIQASIRELRKTINSIEAVQEYLEGECYQSKLKAVESHQDAQAALASHNMTGVFLNSVNKVAQIKIVQILRGQANETKDKLRSLKRNLTALEGLSAKLKTQSQSVKPQVDNPWEAISEAASAIATPALTNADTDLEIEELRRQLDDL
jgi:hypothetical protein